MRSKYLANKNPHKEKCGNKQNQNKPHNPHRRFFCCVREIEGGFAASLLDRAILSPLQLSPLYAHILNLHNIFCLQININHTFNGTSANNMLIA